MFFFDDTAATEIYTYVHTLSLHHALPIYLVLVHDAARPGLPADALKRLIDCCLQSQAGGLLAQPVAETVKLAEQPVQSSEAADGTVDAADATARAARTVPREGLWLDQTTPMFPAGRLQIGRAHV